MLSRVAETLYWSARYIERAENVARLVNINNLLLMDLPRGISPGWEPLIDIIGNRSLYEAHYQDFSEKNVIKFLTLDQRNPSSIFNSLASARDNLRTVRDVVPRQAWEVINGVYYDVRENPRTLLNKTARFNGLKRVIERCLLVFGVLDATMNHDLSFRFVRFGSTLERADMTSRIIDVRSAALSKAQREIPYANIQWMSVLRSLSGYQMYRQEMGVRIRPQDVQKFLFHSAHFPRSILFCVLSLRQLIDAAPNNEVMIERINHSIDELQRQSVDQLKGAALHAYVDELQVDLADIHIQLAEQYFL